MTGRRLTFGYLLGLALLALVTLAGGWMISSILRHQSDDAAIINRAGAQRFLSQRIAGLALLTAHGDAGEQYHAGTELGRAVERMEASHVILRRLAVDRDLGTPELAAYYFAGPDPLDARVTWFITDVRLLGSDANLAGRISTQALNTLLPMLHEAVALHEAAAQGRTRRISRLHQILVALALLLMLLEAVFIFRPLVGRTVAMTVRLKRDADIDALTGLMNRRAITQAMADAVPEHGSAALIAIDLDHFKEVNDADGHAAGDALLRVAAERLRHATRGGDLVGRMGGDEFLVLLPGIASESDAMTAAHRLRDVLHQPVMHQGRLLRLGATLGVALAPIDAPQADGLLRAADEALIRTKRKARGTVGRVTPSDVARNQRESDILRGLKQMDDGPLPGLTAHFQPILDLADGRVRGLEALARWTVAELGPVAPDEFFAVAQRAGLAARLSSEARGHAMAGYAALRREGLQPGRLALNLSAAELLGEGLVDGFERQCLAHGLDFDSVTIEITEDALLDRVAHATLDRLAALRGRGARLSLDDFGTGTSGLAQLMRLPLDDIKLDRSFAQRLGLDGRADRVVEGSIRLAHSMGLEVVAEGIEQAAQAAALRGLGCDMGQGWLYARAMPIEELRGWLVARTERQAAVLPMRRASPAA